MARINGKPFNDMTGDDLIEIRKQTGLNQAAFWGHLGLTQSAGSRYETGRNIPNPILILIQLIYIVGLTPKQSAAVLK